MTTPLELRAALHAIDPLAPDARAQLEALGDRMKEELAEDVDEEVPEHVLEALWAEYGTVDKRLEGEQLLRAPDPIAAAIEARRPDVVARIGSDDAFACALAQTAVHVALPYYNTNAGWIHALVPLATTEARRLRVVTALGGHLQQLVDARLAGGELVNAVALEACARALIRLHPSEAVAALEAVLRFCVHPRCHYEAAATGGAVALALAAADAQASLPVIRAYLEREAKAHPGARNVMEARYAIWLLTDDAAGARGYLEDASHTRGSAFAAAALADLHDPAGIASLEARLATVRNPVTREAFAEALTRLRAQAGPPAIGDRMIGLFGLRTPSELALGMDPDDVFVLRARAAVGDLELGMVTETDDAGDED